MTRCDRQRELAKLKRLQLGPSLASRTAARCIRELARDIADLNARFNELDREIAELLSEHAAGVGGTAALDVLRASPSVSTIIGS
jgi:hypothetical protein